MDYRIISYVEKAEIKDLNFTLGKNEKKIISKEDYDRSQDLKRYANAGLVLATPLNSRDSITMSNNRPHVPNFRRFEKTHQPSPSNAEVNEKLNENQTSFLGDVKRFISDSLYDLKGNDMDALFEKIKTVVESEVTKSRSLLHTSVHQSNTDLKNRINKLEDNIVLILEELKSVNSNLSSLKESGYTVVEDVYRSPSNETRREESSPQEEEEEEEALFEDNTVFIPSIKVSDDIKTNIALQSEKLNDTTVRNSSKALRKLKKSESET